MICSYRLLAAYVKTALGPLKVTNSKVHNVSYKAFTQPRVCPDHKQVISMDHGPPATGGRQPDLYPHRPSPQRDDRRRSRYGRGAKLRVPASWRLLAVLVVQAGLSLRLVHADTAFQDEAAYLWAGHLEWAHWLHGTPIPPFPAYFSGAPMIYPPLGALADALGAWPAPGSCP